MSRTYTLVAIPGLLMDPEHKGQLGFVTFRAICTKTDTAKEQWFVTNTELLEERFAKLVPIDIARELVARLRQGHQVTVPGFYAFDEVRHNFHGRGLE